MILLYILYFKVCNEGFTVLVRTVKPQEHNDTICYYILPH